MGDISDDMQDIAMRWAYDSTVCANGHRYLEDGFGCPRCELELEEGKMRTTIAGSRTITDYTQVEEAMHQARVSGITPTVVLSGTARGVDRLGEQWAAEHGIPVERYPADWGAHGRQAGCLRNIKMANEAEALVAVWDGS